MKQAGYYSQKSHPREPIKVPLVHPIEVAGEEVAELWLGPPSLDDMRGVAAVRVVASLQKATNEAGELDLMALPEDIIDIVRKSLPGMAKISAEEAGSVKLPDFWSLLPPVLSFFADLPAALIGSASP